MSTSEALMWFGEGALIGALVVFICAAIEVVRRSRR